MHHCVRLRACPCVHGLKCRTRVCRLHVYGYVNECHLMREALDRLAHEQNIGVLPRHSHRLYCHDLYSYGLYSYGWSWPIHYGLYSYDT